MTRNTRSPAWRFVYGVTMRERSWWGGLGLVLCAACSSSDGSGASMDMEGTYQTATATFDSACGTDPPTHTEFGPDDTPATLVFTMKSGGVLQMTELPLASSKEPTCKYTFKVQGNVATLDGEQSCSTAVEGATDDMGNPLDSGTSTTKWKKDVFTFDEEGKHLTEKGEYESSFDFMDETCSSTLEATYERVD
jgi:hypothetical protein